MALGATTSGTLWVDAVSLIHAASANTDYQPDSFYVNGVFANPAVFMTTSNSSMAFQIQDASFANLFNADTTNNVIKIGNSTGTDTAITLLQVDSATADVSISLATKNGGIYYNSTSKDLKAIENGIVGTLGSWKYLGNSIAGGSVATVGPLTFTARKHLLIRYRIAGNSGAGIARWQFGAGGAPDTGANYTFTTGDSSAAPTSTTSTTGIQVAGAVVTTEGWGEVEIWNASGVNKRISLHGSSQSSQLALATITSNMTEGMWVNTGQVTQIQLIGNGVNLLTGTEFSVWGADDN